MAGESAVLCTHGDVAAEMLDALAPGRGTDPGPATRLQKGEVWVVQSTGTRLQIVDHLRPPGRCPVTTSGPGAGRARPTGPGRVPPGWTTEAAGRPTSTLMPP